MIDEETAPVVRRIYQLCIEGCGPTRIAKILANDKILKPTAYMDLKAKGKFTVEKPYRWAQKTIVGILEKAEYLGHTVISKPAENPTSIKRSSKIHVRNGRFLKTPTSRLFHSTTLIWFKNFAKTSVETRNMVKSILFQEWSAVRIAERKCTFGVQEV